MQAVLATVFSAYWTTVYTTHVAANGWAFDAAIDAAIMPTFGKPIASTVNDSVFTTVCPANKTTRSSPDVRADRTTDKTAL